MGNVEGVSREEARHSSSGRGDSPGNAAAMQGPPCGDDSSSRQEVDYDDQQGSEDLGNGDFR